MPKTDLTLLKFPDANRKISREQPDNRKDDGPLPRDVVKRIAEDIGKDTAAYISVMYPEAAKACSSTFMMSLRNHIYNQIMAAVEVNDVSEITKRLDERARWRKSWLAQWRRIRRKQKHD